MCPLRCKQTNKLKTNKQTKPLGEEIRSLTLDISCKYLLDIQIDCLSVVSWYLESSGDVWTECIIQESFIPIQYLSPWNWRGSPREVARPLCLKYLEFKSWETTSNINWVVHKIGRKLEDTVLKTMWWKCLKEKDLLNYKLSYASYELSNMKIENYL